MFSNDIYREVLKSLTIIVAVCLAAGWGAHVLFEHLQWSFQLGWK